MDDSLNAALLDVRRAYRLIEDFQHRLLSALEFMRQELGLEFYYHHGRNRVPRSPDGIGGQKNAGRRYLPLNDMSLFWHKHSGQDDAHSYPQYGDFIIDVWLRADSGNGYSGYPATTPEDSDSVLYLHVITCKTHTAGHQNWYSLWNNFPYPDTTDVCELEHYPGFFVCRAEINMRELKDKETLSRCLADFRKQISVKMGVEFA